MNVGIVGSRRRTDKENVERLVAALDSSDVVVSGGCWGVDTWAEEAAKKRGLRTLIFPPNLEGAHAYYQKCERYYARNRKIAEASDVVVAFVASDRTGGTENTLKHARLLGKHIVIVPEKPSDSVLRRPEIPFRERELWTESR